MRQFHDYLHFGDSNQIRMHAHVTSEIPHRESFAVMTLYLWLYAALTAVLWVTRKLRLVNFGNKNRWKKYSRTQSKSK